MESPPFSQTWPHFIFITHPPSSLSIPPIYPSPPHFLRRGHLSHPLLLSLSPSLLSISPSLSLSLSQNDNIDRITNRMKAMHLVPQSWRPADSIMSPRQQQQENQQQDSSTLPPSTPQELGTVRRGLTPHSIRPDKIEKLRDFLGGIEKTPVRVVDLSQCKLRLPGSCGCQAAAVARQLSLSLSYLVYIQLLALCWTVGFPTSI